MKYFVASHRRLIFQYSGKSSRQGLLVKTKFIGAWNLRLQNDRRLTFQFSRLRLMLKIDYGVSI